MSIAVPLSLPTAKRKGTKGLGRGKRGCRVGEAST